MRRVEEAPHVEETQTVRPWHVGHVELEPPWAPSSKPVKILPVAREVEDELIVTLNLPSRFVRRARARKENGAIKHDKAYSRFENLVGKGAYKMALERVGLAGISFNSSGILSSRSYLDVMAESPDQALERALAAKDTIREYLDVEVDPKKDITLCHTWGGD